MKEGLRDAGFMLESSVGSFGILKTGIELIGHNGIRSEAFDYDSTWFNTFTRFSYEVGLPPNIVLGALIIISGAVMYDGARRLSQRRTRRTQASLSESTDQGTEAMQTTVQLMQSTIQNSINSGQNSPPNP